MITGNASRSGPLAGALQLRLEIVENAARAYRWAKQLHYIVVAGGAAVGAYQLGCHWWSLPGADWLNANVMAITLAAVGLALFAYAHAWCCHSRFEATRHSLTTFKELVKSSSARPR